MAARCAPAKRKTLTSSGGCVAAVGTSVSSPASSSSSIRWPNVLSGLIVFPFVQAKSCSRSCPFHRDDAGRSQHLDGHRKAPHCPSCRKRPRKEIVVLALCYAGDPAEGEKLIKPLRGFGTAHGEHIGVQPYTAWQQAFDPLLTRARATTGSHTTSRGSATARSTPSSNTPARCHRRSARSLSAQSAARRPA